MVDSYTQTTSYDVQNSNINIKDEIHFEDPNYSDKKYENCSSGIGSSVNSSLHKIAVDSIEDIKGISVVPLHSKKLVISPGKAPNNVSVSTIKHLDSRSNMEHSSTSQIIQKKMKKCTESSV